MSAPSKGTLWAQSGNGFPRGWHGWWPCGGTSGGKSIGWSRRTAITAHQYRAVMSHWVLTGFPLGQDQHPSSTPPFSLNRSEDKFALVVFSFVSVGFGCYSWHALSRCSISFAMFRFSICLVDSWIVVRHHLIQKTTINCPCYCNFLKT